MPSGKAERSMVRVPAGHVGERRILGKFGWRSRSFWIVVAMTLAAPRLTTSTSSAAPEGAACPVGISQETTSRLFAILNRPPTETGCRFEGVRTEHSFLDAQW